MSSTLSKADAYKYYRQKSKPDKQGKFYWLAIFYGNKKIVQNWHE